MAQEGLAVHPVRDPTCLESTKGDTHDAEEVPDDAGADPGPAEVLLAQAAPMIHHRTPDFSAAFVESIEGLKYVFQTENDVLLFACSGTGVMESAIANCFCAGDTVIVCRNGKFGDRRSRSAEVYGLNVIDLAYEWTEVVRPADIAKALAENPGVRGVIVTQSETSSGVLNDVKAIGEIVRSCPNACSSSTRSPASARWSARPTSGASTWS